MQTQLGPPICVQNSEVGSTRQSFFKTLYQRHNQVPFHMLAYIHGWYALLSVRIKFYNLFTIHQTIKRQNFPLYGMVNGCVSRVSAEKGSGI